MDTPRSVDSFHTNDSTQSNRSLNTTYSLSNFRNLRLNSQRSQINGLSGSLMTYEVIENQEHVLENFGNFHEVPDSFDFQPLKEKLIKTKLLNPFLYSKYLVEYRINDNFASKIDEKHPEVSEFDLEEANKIIATAEEKQKSLIEFQNNTEQIIDAFSQSCDVVGLTFPAFFKHLKSKVVSLKQENLSLNKTIKIRKQTTKEYKNRIMKEKLKISTFQNKLKKCQSTKCFIFDNFKSIKNNLNDLSCDFKQLLSQNVEDCSKISDILLNIQQIMKTTQDQIAIMKLKTANMKLLSHDLEKQSNDLKKIALDKKNKLDQITNDCMDKQALNLSKLNELKTTEETLSEQLQNIELDVAQKQQIVVGIRAECDSLEKETAINESRLSHINPELVKKYFQYKKKNESLQKLKNELNSYVPSTLSLIKDHKEFVRQKDAEIEQLIHENDSLKKECESLDKQSVELDNAFLIEHERHLKDIRSKIFSMNLQIRVQLQRQEAARKEEERRLLEEKIRKEKEEEERRLLEEKIRKEKEEEERRLLEEKIRKEKEEEEKRLLEEKIQKEKEEEERRKQAEIEKQRLEEEARLEQERQRVQKKQEEEERKKQEEIKKKALEEEKKRQEEEEAKIRREKEELLAREETERKRLEEEKKREEERKFIELQKKQQEEAKQKKKEAEELKRQQEAKAKQMYEERKKQKENEKNQKMEEQRKKEEFYQKQQEMRRELKESRYQNLKQTTLEQKQKKQIKDLEKKKKSEEENQLENDKSSEEESDNSLQTQSKENSKRVDESNKKESPESEASKPVPIAKRKYRTKTRNLKSEFEKKLFWDDLAARLKECERAIQKDDSSKKKIEELTGQKPKRVSFNTFEHIREFTHDHEEISLLPESKIPTSDSLNRSRQIIQTEGTPEKDIRTPTVTSEMDPAWLHRKTHPRGVLKEKSRPSNRISLLPRPLQNSINNLASLLPPTLNSPNKNKSSQWFDDLFP